ncbi:MAG: hypothetical protein V7749_18040 [Cocleimonas sp.]
MKNNIFKLIILSVGMISGCSVPSKPTPDAYKGPVATIYDTNKYLGPEKGYFFELESIDGGSIQSSSEATRIASSGSGFHMSPVLKNRKVPAKKSVLTIRGVTSYAAPILSFGGGNLNIKGNVQLMLKANENYYVKGQLSEKYKAIWLEDSRGRVISNKIEIGDKSKQKINKEQFINSSQYSTVRIFNTTEGIRNFMGAGRMKVSINGKSYGTIKSKEYIQIKLKAGKHQIDLSHWDLVTLKSNHPVNINQENTFLGITTTPRSNVLSIDEAMPKGYRFIKR